MIRVSNGYINPDFVITIKSIKEGDKHFVIINSMTVKYKEAFLDQATAEATAKALAARMNMVMFNNVWVNHYYIQSITVTDKKKKSDDKMIYVVGCNTLSDRQEEVYDSRENADARALDLFNIKMGQFNGEASNGVQEGVQ